MNCDLPCEDSIMMAGGDELDQLAQYLPPGGSGSNTGSGSSAVHGTQVIPPQQSYLYAWPMHSSRSPAAEEPTPAQVDANGHHHHHLLHSSHKLVKMSPHSAVHDAMEAPVYSPYLTSTSDDAISPQMSPLIRYTELQPSSLCKSEREDYQQNSSGMGSLPYQATSHQVLGLPSPNHYTTSGGAAVGLVGCQPTSYHLPSYQYINSRTSSFANAGAAEATTGWN